MKKVLLFKLTHCPYCQKTFSDMEDLFAKHPEYKEVELEIIDENEQMEIANQYDYYYVPTFYVDGKKEAEGVLTKAENQAVFEKAICH